MRRKLMARLLWVSVVCALAVAVVRSQDDAAGFIARIEAAQTPAAGELDALTLPELMARFHVPAVSVAVIRGFEIHWAKAYGVADVATGAAADNDTLYQAASISKPVAAFGVLRAVADGRLSLDGDVNRYLQSWKVPASDLTRTQPVTLRALLSHTSGADDGFGFPGYHPSVDRPAVVQILEGAQPSNVGPVLFARPPYAAFKYSGGGVTIAQLAVTEALGRPFPALMDDLVLGPAGMTRSAYEQPLSPARDLNAARAHDQQGQAMDAKWHVYPELEAAGLWTTPTDLARLAIALQRALAGQSRALLPPALAREMITPVGVGPFAVGFQIGKNGEGWYFSHGGSNWGFRATMTAHVRKGYGAAVMTNAGGGGPLAEALVTRIAAAYAWDSLDKPLAR